MSRLNVMEIERFAVHDGPGIRTVVFLKGCGLHCPWCSNPESQSINRQLLHNASRCAACGDCSSVCPNDAISFILGEKPKFDRTKCTACGQCGNTCVNDAISYSGQMMDAEEIVNIVMKDADYYEESGGGVTFSGGEAMCQGARLSELMSMLKNKGVNIAVETCGQFDSAVLDKTVQYIDLFLFDIKHTDEIKLKEIIGGDARLIFGNLSACVKSGKETVARVPIIPGFNHSKAEIRAILEKAKMLGIKKVDLLPYHTLGKSKYEKLGLDYKLCTKMLSKNELLQYLPMGLELGLDVNIV